MGLNLVENFEVLWLFRNSSKFCGIFPSLFPFSSWPEIPKTFTINLRFWYLKKYKLDWAKVLTYFFQTFGPLNKLLLAFEARLNRSIISYPFIEGYLLKLKTQIAHILPSLWISITVTIHRSLKTTYSLTYINTTRKTQT